MTQYRETIKDQLVEELESLHFTTSEEVMKRTYPKSRRERIRALWNKELEIPILPVGVAASLLIIMLFIYPQQKPEDSTGPSSIKAERKWIQMAGNTYWQDDYERVVKRYADKDQG